jgi:hypothetical protein
VKSAGKVLFRQRITARQAAAKVIREKCIKQRAPVGSDGNENVENAEGVQELSLEVCRILELVSARRALEA